MYSEELDWCRVGGCRLEGDVPPIGESHSLWRAEQRPVSVRRHIRFQYSKCRYFEKHHGYLFGQLLRCFIFLNYSSSSERHSEAAASPESALCADSEYPLLAGIGLAGEAGGELG